MTDLYRISIDDKTGATLRGRVHIINPDAEGVPPGRDFPLRMIIEVWRRMREGFFFDSLKDNLPDDRLHCDLNQARIIANNLELQAELERLQGLDHGVEVPLTPDEVAEVRAVHKIRDHAQKEAARVVLQQRYGVERLSVSQRNETSYLMTERDSHTFYEQACDVVTDYRVGQIQNWPPPWDFDEDEEFDEDEYAEKLERMSLADYPYAEFTFTVKDARYIEHLEGGIHISTAIHGEFGWQS